MQTKGRLIDYVNKGHISFTMQKDANTDKIKS